IFCVGVRQPERLDRDGVDVTGEPVDELGPRLLVTGPAPRNELTVAQRLGHAEDSDGWLRRHAAGCCPASLPSCFDHHSDSRRSKLSCSCATYVERSLSRIERAASSSAPACSRCSSRCSRTSNSASI